MVTKEECDRVHTDAAYAMNGGWLPWIAIPDSHSPSRQCCRTPFHSEALNNHGDVSDQRFSCVATAGEDRFATSGLHVSISALRPPIVNVVPKQVGQELRTRNSNLSPQKLTSVLPEFVRHWQHRHTQPRSQWTQDPQRHRKWVMHLCLAVSSHQAGNRMLRVVLEYE